MPTLADIEVATPRCPGVLHERNAKGVLVRLPCLAIPRYNQITELWVCPSGHKTYGWEILAR